MIKYQIILRINISELKHFFNILSKRDIAAIRIVSTSLKVTKIYYYNGMGYYSTDIESKSDLNFRLAKTFNDLSHANNKHNISYDGVFLSCLKFNDDFLFIEHNDKFDDNELYMLAQIEKMND